MFLAFQGSLVVWWSGAWEWGGAELMARKGRWLGFLDVVVMDIKRWVEMVGWVLTGPLVVAGMEWHGLVALVKGSLFVVEW
jgi:hypothetical protein